MVNLESQKLDRQLLHQHEHMLKASDPNIHHTAPRQEDCPQRFISQLDARLLSICSDGDRQLWRQTCLRDMDAAAVTDIGTVNILSSPKFFMDMQKNDLMGFKCPECQEWSCNLCRRWKDEVAGSND